MSPRASPPASPRGDLPLDPERDVDRRAVLDDVVVLDATAHRDDVGAGDTAQRLRCLLNRGVRGLREALARGADDREHLRDSGLVLSRHVDPPFDSGRVITTEGRAYTVQPVFDALGDKLQATLGDLRGRGRLDEEAISRAMREIRLALLEADVNFKVVKDFVARVRERALGADVAKSLTPGQQVVKIVHEELTALMGAGSSQLAFAQRPPTVILLAGLQGPGEKTAAAKLALLLRKEKRKPGLVAADLQRPAAIDQLEKLDGDARGGAALSVKAVTGKPIKLASVGEKLDQLEYFHPDRMASRILGMGDVLSLIERAEQADEKQLARVEAIVLSMTPQERQLPRLIDGRRRLRIARGSGTTVQQVNQLLEARKQMEKMM